MSNDNELNKALAQAADDGDFAAVRRLVGQGADINHGHRPPFLGAYFNGHSEAQFRTILPRAVSQMDATRSEQGDPENINIARAHEGLSKNTWFAENFPERLQRLRNLGTTDL